MVILTCLPQNATPYLKICATPEEAISVSYLYPGNVLFVQTVAHPTHPTQKPVELCEYLIKTYTRPGEVVADLCAGSGTTAVAALNTGRRFVCFESAPAIYGPAAQRIEQARLAVERGENGE